MKLKLFENKNTKKQPKAADIANYIGCTEEEVLEGIEASYGYQPMSLDTSSNDDSDDKEVTLKDKVGQEETSFSNIEKHGLYK